MISHEDQYTSYCTVHSHGASMSYSVALLVTLRYKHALPKKLGTNRGSGFNNVIMIYKYAMATILVVAVSHYQTMGGFMYKIMALSMGEQMLTIHN